MVKSCPVYSIFVVALLFTMQSQASVEKIVYHLHHIESSTFNRVINNIENLKRGMPGRVTDIRLVLQGNSIQMLYPSKLDPRLMSRLLKLKDEGLNIEVSGDNFRKHRHLIEQSLNPGLVENVFHRIIELQQQGYRYLTP